MKFYFLSKKLTMENNDNKKPEESGSETANIRQTNKQQDDRGEINMGGRQFTGDEMDMETGSSGLPTINPDEVNHPNQNLKGSLKKPGEEQ